MHRNNNSTTHKEESYYSVTESKQDNNKDGYFSKKIDPSYDSFFTGPVVKLPVQAKIVMRLENTSSGRQATKKQKRPDNDIKDKIEAVIYFHITHKLNICHFKTKDKLLERLNRKYLINFNYIIKSI